MCLFNISLYLDNSLCNFRISEHKGKQALWLMKEIFQQLNDWLSIFSLPKYLALRQNLSNYSLGFFCILSLFLIQIALHLKSTLFSVYFLSD